MCRELEVLLVQNWTDGATERWLGLDLAGGDRLVDLAGPDQPPGEWQI